MKKKMLTSISLAAVFVLGAVAVNWATVPPPPVNQFLGIYDTKFPNLTRDDCLGCHVSDAVLVQRHHALITTEGKQCLDCHVLVPDGSGGFTFQDFRTCSNCHTTSPHHTTTQANDQDCKFCHGSFIDNPKDGHYIPSYQASSVTPLPDGREVVKTGTTDVVIVNGCEACHQADPTAIDPKTNTVRQIFSNADTHHGTGIQQCSWCHDFSSTTPIRQCEACHGVKSLHNIQKDSPATANLGTIVPGQEELGWGHIGNNWDCVGCHGSWYNNAGSPASATVPAINNQSAYTLTAGKEAVLTIIGASFTNVGGDGTTTYNPVVSITDGTNALTLQPFSVTESEIKVNVPALTQGIYQLRVMKEDKQSNIAKLTVAPQVAIKSAVLGSGSTLTLSGTGFGPAPAADYNSGVGVYAGTTQASIVFWSDTKIIATSQNFTSGTVVTAKTVYGSVSAKIQAATKKTRR